MISIIDVNFFLRKRYYVIICLLVSRIFLSLMRLNLSICLVDMTTNKNITLINGTSVVKEPEFDWIPFEIGIILSSYSVGLLFAPIGGIIAPRIGGVKILGLSIFAIGVLTTLSPLLLKQHVFLYMGSRIVQGIFEAVASPGQGEIFIHWTPPDERTFLVSLASIGYSLGFLLSFPICGTLIYYTSWEVTFYITGGISMIWSLIWLLSVAETPAKDKFMKKVEKDYFKQISVAPSEDKLVHPWKEIFSSKILWVLIIEWFFEGWSASFFGNCLPLYIKDVYNVNIEEVGWLSSVPAYFLAFGKIPISLLADYLRRNEIMSKTKIHKMLVVTPQIVVALCLITVTVTKHLGLLFSMAVFCIHCFSFSVMLVSLHTLPLDIAARHSSFVFSLCNMSRGLGLTMNPLIMGLMIENNTFAEWSRYFYTLSLFFIFSGIMFLFYGSGELQPWAEPKKQDKKNEVPKQT